jgi:hypothetical protein
MFHKDGFKKIGEGIYIYNNFVTEDECNYIVNIAESFSENEWSGRFNTSEEGHKALTVDIDLISQIKKRLSNKLEKGIYLSENLSVVRMKKGATWGLHSDNHDSLKIREKSKQYKDGDEFTLEKNNLWGVIMYFNKFEGGNLYYPNQNKTYQPKKGDLVIHSAEDHCLHGVNELKSDVRYSNSSDLFNLIKVPKGI